MSGVSLQSFNPDRGRRYAVGVGTQKRPVKEWHFSVETAELLFRFKSDQPWESSDDPAYENATVVEIDDLGREIVTEPVEDRQPCA